MYFLCGFGGTELGVVVLKIMLKLDCLSVLWKIVEYKGLVLSEIINDISLRVIFEKNNCKINFKFFFFSDCNSMLFQRQNLQS